MNKEKISSIIRDNKIKNKKFTEYYISFFSIWNTIFVPIVIGAGISYLFGWKDENVKLSIYFILFYSIFFVFHIIFSFAYFYLSKRSDVTFELEELGNEYNKVIKELDDVKKRFSISSAIHNTQKAVIYFTTLIISKTIKEMYERDDLRPTDVIEDSDRFFSEVLGYLSEYREVLFGYESESKYNIALYVYNPESTELHVRARFCDDRLTQRNRSWARGFGHVGLTYLHKEIKMCPDIKQSTELNSDDEIDNLNYRSFFSIPILAPISESEADECIGVLVLTSAKPNQFKIERDKEFLSNFSYLLSMYLYSMYKIYVHDTSIDEDVDDKENKFDKQNNVEKSQK